MSSQHQLLLSWKEHDCALVSVFENLLKRNTLVDCTLAAEGQYLKAHKVVLSACSSYFELLFSQESEKNPIVILKDVKFEELEAAVNFMYRGEVEVFADRLEVFLEVAESLQIKGLGGYKKTHDSNEKSDPVNSSRNSVFPRQKAKNSAFNICGDKYNERSNSPGHVTESNNTESSSRHQQAWGNLHPLHPVLSSSINPSTLYTNQQLSQSDDNSQDKDKCSSPVVQNLSSSETVPSEVNSLIKNEPVSEVYFNDKCHDEEYMEDVTEMDGEGECSSKTYMHQGQHSKNNAFNICRDVSNENSNLTVHIDQNSNSGSFPLLQLSWGENPSSPLPSPSPGIVPSTSSSIQQFPQSDSSAIHPNLPSSESEHSELNSVTKNQMYKHNTCNDEEFADDETMKIDVQEWKELNVESIGDEHSTKRPYFEDRHPLSDESFNMGDAGGGPVACGVCNKVFKRKEHLNQHRKLHTGERPYSCPICGRKFARKEHLARHIVTHTGQKTHVCVTCGKSFSRKDNLRKHHKTCVKGTFVCKVCGMSFDMKHNFEAHKITHFPIRISSQDVGAAPCENSV